MMRHCAGCDFDLTGARINRRWCSEACRVRTYYATRPEEAAEQRSRNLARQLAAYAPRVYPGRTCITCSEAFTARSKNTPFCSLRCRRRHDRPLDRFRRRATVRAGERFTSREIFERDGWRCGLCCRRIDPSLTAPHHRSATLDHVVPVSAGGEHTKANVQAAHWSCNSAKGARAAGEQLRMIG